MSLGQKTTGYDKVKWVVVILGLIAALIANNYYSTVALPIRLAALLLIFCVLIFIALQTGQGHVFRGFLHEARIEVRKVVWPSRKETLQTTGFVILVVIITGFFLWGIDSFFMWVMSWLTGQRG